jgi:hypothetical protein
MMALSGNGVGVANGLATNKKKRLGEAPAWVWTVGPGYDSRKPAASIRLRAWMLIGVWAWVFMMCLWCESE